MILAEGCILTKLKRQKFVVWGLDSDILGQAMDRK